MEQSSKTIMAALYIRVSTEHQVKEGYSIAAQKENLTKFVEQQGWNIFDIYADEGISGKNIQDRPDVKRLINDIKEQKVNVVVLYKFDRLTRDMSDTEDIIKLIQQCGIEVYTISGGSVDVTTATGRFLIRMTGAVAQLEREQTIERVKVAFVQKVKEGKSLCSSTPSYGYDRPKHQEIQTINKDEAIIVKRIFNMYIEGKTYTEIAKILNAEGIPTKKKGKIQKRRLRDETYIINSVWLPKTIRLILSNITYIGGVRYGVNSKNGFVELNGRHESIVEKSTWDKAQERLNKTKRTFKTNHPKDEVYYCGTLVCGICKERLTTKRTIKTKKDGSKTVYNAYRCINKEKGQCTALGVSHKKVEEAFLTYIDSVEKFTEIKNINLSFKEDKDLTNANHLKKRLIENDKKRKEIMHLFMKNKINHEQMEYMTTELKNETIILKNELQTLENNIQPITNIDKSTIPLTLKEHWTYLTNKQRLEFLNLFVEEIIIVNKDNDRLNGKPEMLKVKFYDQ